MKAINAITLILLAAAVIFTLIFLFSPGALGISERGTAYEKYFDSEAVTTVNITISADEWNDILENPLAEEYHTADIEINGDFYSGVGIRTKGMTSLTSVASSDSDRYSFRIQADEYVSGQSFAGLNEFVLNNNYQDPTYMKEFLSYELMEELDVPTPLHAYAAVYINGEYRGLYLMVEAVEEDFALRSFGADYGELYKPETMNMGGGDRAEGGMPDFGGEFSMPEGFSGTMPNRGGQAGGEFSMPEGFGGTMPNRGGQTGGEFSMPEGFGGTMPNRGGHTGEEFSMPEGFGGVMADFGGFGGFSSGGGADLVYTNDSIESYSQIFDNAVLDGVKDADKKRVIASLKSLADSENLETDVDVDEVLRYFAANTALVNLDSYVGSFKHNYYLYEEDGKISILPWDFNLAFGTFQSGDAEGVVNFPIDTPVSEGTALADRPLIGALLEVSAYKEQYHEYLRYIAEEFFGPSFSSRVAGIDALIGEYVKTDPTAFSSYAEYQEGLAALNTYAELRAESIIGQLNGTIPSTHEGQKNSTALINANALNMHSLGPMGGGGFGGR